MNRRDVLGYSAMTLMSLVTPGGLMSKESRVSTGRKERPGDIRVFLCGDVMTGRGIDQVLPHPGKPEIYESYLRSALGYVEIAEAANGPIPRPVDFAYIWGDALSVLERATPDLRIVNLETSITSSDDYWPEKGINYRMHPKNVPCLVAAGIDCCALANNHVLDWGYAGLLETLTTLEAAGIAVTGAGRDRDQAQAPAVLELAGKGRVLVFSLGHHSSGIPRAWAASATRPGIHCLPDLSRQTITRIGGQVRAIRQPGDVVIASIHWGGNWGYEVPAEHGMFARRLIESAAVDVVHGHSSHHPRPIEIHQGKTILYGCGDFLNDYEGIGGHEAYRGDLTLMYFLDLEPETGKLRHLEMVPMQIRNFALQRASTGEASWLAATLNRAGRQFDNLITVTAQDTLLVDG